MKTDYTYLYAWYGIVRENLTHESGIGTVLSEENYKLIGHTNNQKPTIVS